MNRQRRLVSISKTYPVRRLRIVAVAALLALAASFTILTLAIPSFAQDSPNSPAAPPTAVYVDKDATGGAGDGTSWTDAYTNIQDALYGATAVEIWVAEGVYYPDEGKGQTSGDPTATFRIGDAVTLYGGFSGTEEDLQERDWVNNVTVLSGDIDHNDTTDANGVVTDPEDIDGDNSYHVVTTASVMSSAKLNGFVITAGLANSTTEAAHYKGAGIYSIDASPELANLIIQGNKAAGGLPESPEGCGGGIYIEDRSPAFAGVTLRNNFAQISGGGLYTTNADGSIAHLTLISNDAGISGGGMYVATSAGHALSNLTFTGNSAGECGGGLYVQSDVRSSLGGDSQFTSNLAASGGGLCVSGSILDLSSVDFAYNDATDSGGGIFAQDSELTLEFVDLAGNSADVQGGGISAQDGEFTLEIVNLAGNHADLRGGGIFSSENVASLNNAIFTYNDSVEGAGMYVDDEDNAEADLTITNAVFHLNTASQDGGALYVTNSWQGTLNGVSFLDNEATDGSGGGMFVDSSDATLTDVLFDGNESTQDGGGMLSSGAGSNLVIVNVAFSGNAAGGSGAGLSTSSQNVTLVNVLFSGNDAGGSGSGLSTASANIEIINATFSGNAAAGSGGGVSTTSPNMTIDNTIIWNNQDIGGTGTSDASISGAAEINHSLIHNQIPLGTGNLDGTVPLNDPLFVIPADPTTTPPTLGILSVKFGSPIVDVGNNAVITPTGITVDLASNTRIYTDTVDMGAYELQLACPPPETTRLYVDDSASGGNTGESGADALEDLRDAFTLAANCEGIVEIWVAEGVYRPDEGVGMVPNSQTETYELIDGVKVYGGFDGPEFNLEERDWANNVTVLSGDVDGNDINSGDIVLDPEDINGYNSYHVVIASGASSTTLLDGFVITAGQANGNPLDQADLGAGLYNDASSPTLANLTFIGNIAENGGGVANVNGSSPPMVDVQLESNEAVFFGGAIYNKDSAPSLTDVQFQTNVAGSSGGAIYNKDCDSLLTDVQFQSNSAGSFGGAIYNEDSDPSLTNTLLSGNTASAGAAIYNTASHPSLTNALLSGNSASEGAAIHNTASHPILVNVTVTGNRASSSAGGMFNTSTSLPTVHNSIFWDNQDSTGTGTASATIHNDDLGSVPLINYSLVQALSGIGDTGTNNLDENPWFTTPLDPAAAPTTAGDLTLGVFSPAIDVGDKDANSTLTDLAGNPRKINVVIDLGAYEAPYRPIYDIYLPAVMRDYP